MAGRARAVLGALAIGATLCAAPARAHTAYMLPSTFATPSATEITVLTSFSEDCCKPEIVVTSDDFHLYRPDGRRDTYDKIASFKQVTVLESDLTEKGTYRFTSGIRLGRSSTQYLINGVWTALEPGKQPPKGAKSQTSQTETLSDVYVTKGAPTKQVVDLKLGRLAIHPITHPNEIYLESGFKFELLFDGKPLANYEMELFRDGGTYDEKPFKQAVKTDKAGMVDLSFKDAGIYMIMTRHAAPAPAGAQSDQRSYTTSLTFEVAR
jgi:Domain of unknown function (DUF4198)